MLSLALSSSQHCLAVRVGQIEMSQNAINVKNRRNFQQWFWDKKFIACATDGSKGGAIRKPKGMGAGEVQKNIYSRGGGGGVRATYKKKLAQGKIKWKKFMHAN